jgi:signal transduction histidine kinase
VISVSDDGPGVTTDEQETIFDSGVRGGAADQRRDGSGLGLALALRVARSAGGSVTAQKSDSGGLFIVELPLV